MEQQIIIPSDFVQRMEQHWITLGNISSEPLRQTWRQLADAFNFNISTHDNPRLANQWTVVQPKTGTGKSQGALVYCSMLSDLPEHPGALIVTRLIEEADRLAAQVNTLSGRQVAFAYHSESKALMKLSELKEFPVLVITHRAYEMALDYLGQEGTIQKTWPYFHSWKSHTRKLVVIDECLDLVEHSETDMDTLRKTIGDIPQKVLDQFPVERDNLEELLRILQDLNRKLDPLAVPETMVLQQMVNKGSPPDFTRLRQALWGVRFDWQIHRKDPYENERIRQWHDNVLKGVHHLFRSWLYYARINAKHTLNNARLLLPEGVKGAVVMDATASSNLIYKLFEYVVPYRPPEGARSYQNVTLHVSQGHRVGKVFMEDNGKQLCSDLISRLNAELAGRNCFIITHKNVEPVLKTFETTFQMKTGHWGKVDGSNEFRECDTCVVFGLPYRPDTWTANTFMAYQGPQEDEWLRGDGERPFAGYTDIRQALKLGQIITETVQAVNRVRCRKVIDDQGNCPPTDIYLMLPDPVTSKVLLDSILSQMPQVKVVEWPLGTQKAKAKKSNFEPALVCYFESMDAGRESKAVVQRNLGMSGKTMDRLMVLAKEPDSELAKAMAKTGIVIQTIRLGRSPRTYFVKSQ